MECVSGANVCVHYFDWGICERVHVVHTALCTAFFMALCACGLYCCSLIQFLLHLRSQKHQLLHLPPRLRLPQHIQRLKRYVGLAVVGGASGGVVMRFVCYKYVKHGVCVW